ncbi:MAG: hypothetical protein KDK23_11850 [Leptospiraceae bacterium]|nr:hypothetical protein [Leptospiraceae bacterium]
MFFAIVAGGGGLYLMLMAAGLIHREYMKSWNRPRKLALTVMGAGFFILGMYFGYLAYFLSTPAGQDFQRLQRDLNRDYMQTGPQNRG